MIARALADALDRREDDAGMLATEALNALESAGFSVTLRDGLSRYLTTTEAAARRRRTVQALTMERQRNVGPPYVQDGGRILYPEDQLEQWMAERTITPKNW